jgi:predicted phage terminase large subunit-like protein
VDVRSATPAGWARYASGGAWRAAPHLLVLNRVLMAAAAGEKWASRVIFQLPPRIGKSEFVSGYFPSWFLGLYPDKKLILASYEQGLASTWGQRNRDLLEAYGQDVFGVRVRQDSQAKHDWKISRRRGGMFTTGIGGALTGRGAHGIIIDDPVKNDQEALSPTYRERAKAWYKATARTRLEPNGFIFVIQTRWHEDDLAGWLQTEKDEDWLVISLPAIAEEDEAIYLPDNPVVPAWTRKTGDVIWPWRYTLSDMLATQRALGGPDGHWWTALYQQSPAPIGGGVLKPEQFRRFRIVEDGYLLDTPAGPEVVSSASLQKFATMDLATSVKTAADFTALGVFGLAFPNLLVLDVLHRKMEGPDLPKIAAIVWKAYAPAYFAVESAGYQLSTVQDMRRGAQWEHPPRPGLPVKAITPQGDKVTRALTLATRMSGGNIYVPERAPWLAGLEKEMALFPVGQHDDQVDMLAYAALEAMDFGGNFMTAE